MTNKVTPQEVQACIRKEQFVILPDNKTTICILTLDNGYTVRGESSCVDPANFKKEDGEQYSRVDAVRKIWPLLGFRLADRLMLERNLAG